jgi:hypothetical protein
MVLYIGFMIQIKNQKKFNLRVQFFEYFKQRSIFIFKN